MSVVDRRAGDGDGCTETCSIASAVWTFASSPKTIPFRSWTRWSAPSSFDSLMVPSAFGSSENRIASPEHDNRRADLLTHARITMPEPNTPMPAVATFGRPRRSLHLSLDNMRRQRRQAERSLRHSYDVRDMNTSHGIQSTDGCDEGDTHRDSLVARADQFTWTCSQFHGLRGGPVGPMFIPASRFF